MRARAVLLAELLFALTFVGACGANLPAVPLAPPGNDPVPLPADLRDKLELSIQPSALHPVDGTSPPVSASKALEVAGRVLLADLSGNNVPAQDASAPDGLVRRLYVERAMGQRPPTSVWIVAYRWDAGFNCRGPNGGPGPCATTSFYFVDDRTGDLVYSLTQTD